LKGIYILEIFISNDFYIDAKRFAGIKFIKGFYYYIGSAQKNIIKRLERHLNKNKITHWHIDHLTNLNISSIINIIIFEDALKSVEALMASSLSHDKKLSPIPNFGNSDTPGTISHLFFSERKIAQNHFISLYQSQVRLIPSSIDIF